MFKGLVFLLIIGFSGAYIVKNFVGEIQEETGVYSSAKKIAQTNQKYYRENSIGELVLDLEGTPDNEQVRIWQESPVKSDILAAAPNFEEMRYIAQERLCGSPIKEKVNGAISEAENDFVSGELKAEEIDKLFEF
ncbi:MAG: hypothetical protein P8Y43_03365 [Sulfurovaceae bacterium]